MKQMTSRERRIEWIKANYFGRFPYHLMTECVCEFGLDWFTDDQIKDMVREEIGAWRRMSRTNVRNRKAWAEKQAAQNVTC